MGFLGDVLLFFSSNSIIISILGGFLGGEEIVLFLAFLSGQGTLPFWILFVFASLGTIMSNIMWYGIGKLPFIDRILRWRPAKKGFNKVVHLIDTSERRNELLVLFLSKLVYGLRIISIILLSKKGMKLPRFLLFSSLTAVAWYLIVLPIGWLAGRGFIWLVDVLKSLQLAVTFVVVVTMVFFAVRWAIHAHLVKKHRLHKK